MDLPDFLLYQLSHSRCLATLVGRIRTCDSDVIQTDSRFVYGLRRSYGADVFLSYSQPAGLWTGLEPVTSSLDALSPCSPFRQSHCSKLLNEDFVEIIALIDCYFTLMKKQPTVGTRVASHKDADLAHYLGSLQVRYLRILIVRMESRAAVEHSSSILFPKSTRRDWHHQKRPEWRQQRLNSLLIPQTHTDRSARAFPRVACRSVRYECRVRLWFPM